MPLVWVADLAAGTPGGRGRRWLGGQQAAPRTYERGREYGREISRRCGECLYLRRNCPLNARLRFRSILYALNINTPYTHDFGGVSRRCRKSPRKTRAHSTEPEAEKSPGRLRAYRGGCSFGVFRRVNEYQERHEQDIKQHQAPSTSSRSISSRSQSSGAWGWRVTTPPRAMRSISRVSRV